MNTCIVGAGLSGLAARHVLGKNPVYEAGLCNSPFKGVGPMWLHKHPLTEKLLAQLNLCHWNMRTRRIGVWFEGTMWDEADGAKDTVAALYCQKTRKCLPSELPEKESLMNFGKTEIETYDIPEAILFNQLSNVKMHLMSPVTKITKDAMFIAGGVPRVFTNMVATIPLPELAKTIGYKINLPATTIYKYQLAAPIPIFLKYERDCIYFPEEEYIFHRMTGAGVEVSAAPGSSEPSITKQVEEDLGKIGGRLLVPRPVEIRRYGHFMAGGDNPSDLIGTLKDMNVYCLGRYACWNHKIKFGEVLEDLEIIKKEVG